MVNTVRSRLLALMILALAAYGVERLIVTDTEAIEGLAEAMAEDIRTSSWDALEGRLHEEFTYDGKDRAATVAHVRSLVGRYHPTEVGVILFDIEVDGDDARAKGQIWGRVVGRSVRVTIAAKLRRTDEGDWVLLEVTGGTLGR